MQALKFWWLLLFSGWVPLLTRADEGRYRLTFRSPNKQYELRLLQPSQRPSATTWGLYRKASAHPLYTLTSSFADKTVYLTNDGEAFAVVDDYCEAAATDSLEVLSFYRNGTKVRGYRLDELLCSSYNISGQLVGFKRLPSARVRYL